MNYSARDEAVVWHPFTQMQIDPIALPIVRGQGAWLYDDQNRAYLDAVSSWWVNLHGHCHPHIVRSIAIQAAELDHVIFAGYTHPKAIELAERLLEKLPRAFERIFYSDNGSTAVEVALKMSLQYWHNRGEPKTKILYLEGAYHGDTFGAMAASQRSAFTEPFAKLMFEATAIPLPIDSSDEALATVLKEIRTGDVAAFLFEPLVQGAGGFRFQSAEKLSALIKACQDHGVLTIADEVMTGFGRTGTLFAIDQVAAKPDMICLSKGITGGTLPLAVTACTRAVYEAFLADDRMKTFFHGHSYTANAIACAAACASLDLLESNDSQAQRVELASHLSALASRLKNHPRLRNVRCRGGILAAEVAVEGAGGYQSSVGREMAAFFQKRLIIIRPLGNTFYLMPPYCTTVEHIKTIEGVLKEFLDAKA